MKPANRKRTSRNSEVQLNERERRAKERAIKKLMPTHSKDVAIIRAANEKILRFLEEQNPTTFEIPREMVITMIFPGDDKGQ